MVGNGGARGGGGKVGKCKHHLRFPFPPPPEARSQASLDGGLFTFSIRMIQTWHVCLFGASRCVSWFIFPLFHTECPALHTAPVLVADGQSIVNNLISE